MHDVEEWRVLSASADRVSHECHASCNHPVKGLLPCRISQARLQICARLDVTLTHSLTALCASKERQMF
jgi:hypothetical protein